MTPDTVTSTRVSFSGRRSTLGSPPSTKKYGESVLSAGGRSVCASADAGASESAMRTSTVGKRLAMVMADHQATPLPVRRPHGGGVQRVVSKTDPRLVQKGDRGGERVRRSPTRVVEDTSGT